MIHAVDITVTLHRYKRWLHSYLSHLNPGVHLRLVVVLHVLQAGASLAGRGDCVTPPTAPGHGQVAVVRQLSDALTAQPERNIEHGNREKVCLQLPFLKSGTVDLEV